MTHISMSSHSHCWQSWPLGPVYLVDTLTQSTDATSLAPLAAPSGPVRFQLLAKDLSRVAISLDIDWSRELGLNHSGFTWTLERERVVDCRLTHARPHKTHVFVTRTNVPVA